MTEFTTAPLVAADPDANTTDLLVDRVKATPDSVLFSLPAALRVTTLNSTTLCSGLSLLGVSRWDWMLRKRCDLDFKVM